MTKINSLKKQKLQKLIAHQNEKLSRIQNFRLLSGIIFGVCLILIPITKSDSLTLIALIYWVLIFPLLVKWTRLRKNFISHLEEYFNFLNRIDLKKQGQIPPNQSLSNSSLNELNITGSNSLYDYINECWTLESSNLLEENLVSPKLSEIEIQKRQNIIQSLTQVYFPMIKLLFKMKNMHPSIYSLKKSLSSLVEIKNSKWVENSTLVVWGALVVVAFLSLNGMEQLNPFLSALIVLFWLGQVVSYQKRGIHFLQAIDIEKNLNTLLPIFEWVHQTKWNTGIQKICPQMITSQPAKHTKKVKLFISLMSVETHVLVTVLVNMFFPYHILVYRGLAKNILPILKIKDSILNEITNLDFYNSILILYKNFTSTFPEFKSNTGLQVKNVYLPLINHESVIKNDFKMGFGDVSKVTLITGSNMSGKSTFLRAVAQNQALALMGAPVFADEFITCKARLVSCINVTDSVLLSYSYFLSEVKKLKEIYEISKKEKVIFFLDELFRGTNQKERIIAAKSYLKEISSFDCLAFLTTHDQEITELAIQDNKFKTYYFSEDFDKEDISFTYKIQSGIATTTNALRILKREGLPVYDF